MNKIKKIRDSFRRHWKTFCVQKFEVKIGLLFLVPPIIGAISFVLYACTGWGNFPEAWTCVTDSVFSPLDSIGYGYAGTSALPIYLGLMAIAGAYLIKGNIRRLDDER